MSNLSIVIPAFNEEEHIEHVVLGLLSAREKIQKETDLKDVEVIVVNDGSTDQTGSRLKSLPEPVARHIRVVTHEMNLGYGAALKTGFRAAKGDYLSFMDADGTLDPVCFIRMYERLRQENADMVVGTRLDRKHSKMPVIRKVGNRFFAMFLSFLAGRRVGDTASGMRIFRKEIIPQLHPLPDGLHFTPAMSTKALHERMKLVEEPIPYSVRQGDSKLNVVSDGVRFLRIILSTVLMYNPFKVFFFVGLLFEIIAAALVSVPIYEFIAREPMHFSDYIYRSIGGMYFFTVGVQIILFGVLARFVVSTFFKRHETGEFLHTLNRVIRPYTRMGYYGIPLFLAGAAINAMYFWKYLFGTALELHWAWLLLAAAFIIVGLQMMITDVLMRILRDIKAASTPDPLWISPLLDEDEPPRDEVRT